MGGSLTARSSGSDQGSGSLPGGCANAPCDTANPTPGNPPVGPLAAVKTAEDATDNGGFYVGDVVRYTLTVTNSNVVTFTNVRITDVLPSGLQLIAVESVSAGCADQSSGNVVRVLCNEVAPSGTAEVVFTAQVLPQAAGQPINNLFRWTADQWPDSNNPSNVCANAPCGGSDAQPGGAAHKAGVGDLTVGAPVTYTLVVTNATPVTLVNVRITDTLPAQLQLTSVAMPSGCSDQSSGNTAVVVCGALAAGQSVTVEVYATVVTTTGQIINSFVWSADNLGPQRPEECWDLPCDSDQRPNLDNSGTEKVSSATAVRVGDLITYTITLSNSGQITAVATVTDALDSRLTLVSATPTPDQTSGGVLVWQNVSVPPDGTVTLEVTVRAGANTPLTQPYSVTNAVTVTYGNQSLQRQAGAIEVMPRRTYFPAVRRLAP